MKKLLTRSLPILRAVAGRNFSDTSAAEKCSRRGLLNLGPARHAGPSPRSERSLQFGSWQDESRSLTHHGSFPGQTAAGCHETELSSITAVVQGSKTYATSSPSGIGDAEAPTASDVSTLLPEKEFHKLADDVLHQLQEKLEDQGDILAIEGFDTDYADGVLTIRLGSLGTYVLNKQTPNRQIWFSSPVSGPARFDWVKENGSWIYKRTKVELVPFLENELSKLLKTPIPLS